MYGLFIRVPLDKTSISLGNRAPWANWNLALPAISIVARASRPEQLSQLRARRPGHEQSTGAHNNSPAKFLCTDGQYITRKLTDGELGHHLPCYTRKLRSLKSTPC